MASAYSPERASGFVQNRVDFLLGQSLVECDARFGLQRHFNHLYWVDWPSLPGGLPYRLPNAR